MQPCAKLHMFSFIHSGCLRCVSWSPFDIRGGRGSGCGAAQMQRGSRVVESVRCRDSVLCGQVWSWKGPETLPEGTSHYREVKVWQVGWEVGEEGIHLWTQPGSLFHNVTSILR